MHARIRFLRQSQTCISYCFDGRFAISGALCMVVTYFLLVAIIGGMYGESRD